MKSMHVILTATLVLFCVVEQPAAQQTPQMKNLKVIVASTNDEWTDSGIRVFPGDVVAVASSGEIDLGGLSGAINAEGFGGGNGSLRVKIGVNAEFTVGANHVVFPKQEGTLKLRVHDSNYSDNEGHFEVVVLYIPKGAIPAETVVTGD